VDAWVKTGGTAEPVDKIAEIDFERPKNARKVSATDGANQTD